MKMMTIADAWLLVKKIAVGIVITVVPLAILAGGLWLTQEITGVDANKKSSEKVVSHAN
jgi:hypothetical protein